MITIESAAGRRSRGRRRAAAISLALAVLGVAAWLLSSGEKAELTGPPTPDVAIPQTEAMEDSLVAAVEPSDTAVEAVGQPTEAATWCKSAERTAGAECRITTSLRQPKPRPKPTGLPVSFVSPRSLGRASIPDAPDPFVLVDGETYYVFSTSAQFIRIPVTIVPAAHLVPFGGRTPGYGVDPNATGSRVRHEALSEDPAWAVPGQGIWAPTAARLGGRFVMFFAAKRPDPPDPPNAECVGRAFADQPEGPYVPEPTPFTCGLGGVHGALDPSIFLGTKGRPFLHVAFGGTSTPLWVIPLTRSGDAAAGPSPLLSLQQPWESWFLENPSMVADGSAYVLAYSVGDWRSPGYSTGIARCATPMGPCTSTPKGPWLASRNDLSGPGGLAFFHDVDGALMVAYHAYTRGREANFGERSTFIRRARVLPSPRLL